ncbi:hypothetical protein [Desulfobulbus oligotrophicus]|uniref:Uncharacterized protein n=1 Tax=Desulfobulbus oligotrophicus TaxID=1909699 RepID=A0A7T5VDL7_9BACT|nr:hypothetical protein [Desulfobulbus oligotrophicus]QQG65952.1 hypothetical protein HP555_08765 [Desulfobulbus oligotrophicus]
MSLLQAGKTVLLELRLRISDLPRMFCRKQVGHEQRPDLDLPGLRTDPYDGIARAVPVMTTIGKSPLRDRPLRYTGSQLSLSRSIRAGKAAR